jgi:hypothetical protein
LRSGGCRGRSDQAHRQSSKPHATRDAPSTV